MSFTLGNKNWLRECYGEFTFSNGSKYKGEWKNYETNGFGKCTYYNGTCMKVNGIKGNFKEKDALFTDGGFYKAALHMERQKVKV